MQGGSPARLSMPLSAMNSTMLSLHTVEGFDMGPGATLYFQLKAPEWERGTPFAPDSPLVASARVATSPFLPPCVCNTVHGIVPLPSSVVAPAGLRSLRLPDTPPCQQHSFE